MWWCEDRKTEKRADKEEQDKLIMEKPREEEGERNRQKGRGDRNK